MDEKQQKMLEQPTPIHIKKDGKPSLAFFWSPQPHMPLSPTLSSLPKNPRAPTQISADMLMLTSVRQPPLSSGNLRGLFLSPLPAGVNSSNALYSLVYPTQLLANLSNHHLALLDPAILGRPRTSDRISLSQFSFNQPSFSDRQLRTIAEFNAMLAQHARKGQQSVIFPKEKEQVAMVDLLKSLKPEPTLSDLVPNIKTAATPSDIIKEIETIAKEKPLPATFSVAAAINSIASPVVPTPMPKTTKGKPRKKRTLLDSFVQPIPSSVSTVATGRQYQSLTAGNLWTEPRQSSSQPWLSPFGNKGKADWHKHMEHRISVKPDKSGATPKPNPSKKSTAAVKVTTESSDLNKNFTEESSLSIEVGNSSSGSSPDPTKPGAKCPCGRTTIESCGKDCSYIESGAKAIPDPDPGKKPPSDPMAVASPSPSTDSTRAVDNPQPSPIEAPPKVHDTPDSVVTVNTQDRSDITGETTIIEKNVEPEPEPDITFVEHLKTTSLSVLSTRPTEIKKFPQAERNQIIAKKLADLTVWESCHPAPTEADFSHLELALEDIHALAKILTTNTSLTVINLDDCHLNDQSLNILANALKLNRHILKLSIDKNPKLTSASTPTQLQIAACLVRNGLLSAARVSPKDLEKLDFSVTSAAQFRELLERHPEWTSINFSAKKLRPESDLFLSTTWPRYPALTHLNLSNNQLGDEGVGQLANVFSEDLLPSLTTLDLSNNNIEDAGFLALALALLHLTNLTECRLDYNYLTFEGFKDFLGAAGLHEHPHLQTLSLRENIIKCSNKQALDEQLPKAFSLEQPLVKKRIDVTGNYFMSDGYNRKQVNALYLFLLYTGLTIEQFSQTKWLSDKRTAEPNLRQLNLEIDGVKREFKIPLIVLDAFDDYCGENDWLNARSALEDLQKGGRPHFTTNP